MAELIVYDRRVTDEEREKIENYLRLKWLFGAHPVAESVTVNVAANASLVLGGAQRFAGLTGSGMVEGAVSARVLAADGTATAWPMVNGTFTIPEGVTVNFSNVDDERQIFINIRLFDVLFENLMVPQRLLHSGGNVTLNYEILPDEKSVRLIVGYIPKIGMNQHDSASDMMSASVCQLLTKRLGGSFQMKKLDKGQLQYVVTLPLDSREDVVPLEDPESPETEDRSMLPFVLLGVEDKAEMYQNQHLFDVNVCTDTSRLFEVYEKTNPDIVFIDRNLPGSISVIDLISQMSALHAETPIIVLSDEAERQYHKQIQQLGARYLLTNPLTLRKVNMMIKKYLK